MAKTETIRTKQKYHAGDTVGCHEVLETLGVIGSTARRDQKYVGLLVNSQVVMS